jgi:hypothetical protein
VDASRPHPDPPPPIRGLWRGRHCSRSSIRPSTARISTWPCRNSDSAPLAARRPPCPYARRPSLPAWPGEGGRWQGGEQGERGLRGRGGAMLGFRQQGRAARLGLHLLYIFSMRGGSREGEARRRRGSGWREEAEGRGRQWNRVWGSFYTKQTQF